MNLEDYIVDVPDWPKEGIVFKDITPLLKDNNALNHSTLLMRGLLDSDIGANCIVGCEARGFIFGSYLAKKMWLGFIPVRKKGKLPPPVISRDYELEYGTDTLEIKPGDGERVIIVDDVYATGGTLEAAEELCKISGYRVVDKVCLVDIGIREIHDVKCLIHY